jgi:hypothetical protein
VALGFVLEAKQCFGTSDTHFEREGINSSIRQILCEFGFDNITDDPLAREVAVITVPSIKTTTAPSFWSRATLGDAPFSASFRSWIGFAGCPRPDY